MSIIEKLKNNHSPLLFISVLVLTDIFAFEKISFFGQIFLFIILTVLPGFLILNLFKTSEIELTENLLLSIGLSISYLMFTGLFINFLYLAIGFSRPLSIFPLLGTINISLSILYILNYNFNKNFFPILIHNWCIRIREDLSRSAILLFLIPLLSILGALIVRYYNSSIISMLLIAVIAVIVVLIGFGKLIPARLYPLGIFLIGSSLILNRTLTSQYLFGSDIHYEYFFQKIVELNSYWDPNISSSNANAMLSTVMLPTVYSILLDLDGIWVYKIIYPLIFSFVPLILYQIFRKQISDKYAFLSAFFFMSFFSFFINMSFLPRQQIAELFLVLIVLLIVHKEIGSLDKSILLIVFIASLVVSHYATTYIFIFYIFCVFGLSRFMNDKITSLTISIVLFSIIIAISWYIYASGSSIFISAVNLGDNIYTSITYDMFFSSNARDPDIARGLGSGIAELAPLHAMHQFLQIITQLLIVSGFIYAILRQRAFKFDRNFLIFSSISMVLIFLCIVLPYLASSMNMNRIYQVLLIFLSPFCIIGAELIHRIASNLLKIAFFKNLQIRYLIILIILIPYFLFNAGFVYEAIESPANLKIDLNQSHSKNLSQWSNFVVSPIPEQEVVSCKWLSHKIGGDPVYADAFRVFEILAYGFIRDIIEIRTPSVPENCYIFLGYQNVNEGILKCWDTKNVHTLIDFTIAEISPSLSQRNKIYSNGNSEFYR